MRRRELLQGLSAFAISQMVLGCQSSNPNALQVYLLKNALPPQLLRDAQRAVTDASELRLKAGLSSLYEQLESWQSDGESLPLGPRLVSLGDYWLTPAIQKKLLQPLDPQQFPHWSALPLRWQDLVRRDLSGAISPDGKVWGAPYRWGMTLLAYRHDKFQSLGWTPTNWSDLWRPELKNRLSLPNQAREVIGLTLKSLGQSYNLKNPADLKTLLPRLKQLNQQVKFYSSTQYLQPLIMGDTWAAVGWSTDILPIVARESQLRVIAPADGSALWADLWVQAANAERQNPAALNEWIDFWWDDEIVNTLSSFTNALSPLQQTFSGRDGGLSVLLANSTSFERSEFLRPLSIQSIRQFQDLWRQMRV